MSSLSNNRVFLGIGLCAMLLAGCHAPNPGGMNRHLNESEQKVPGEFQGTDGGMQELQNKGPGPHDSEGTQDHTKGYSGTGPNPPVSGEQETTPANEQDDRTNQ